MEENELLRTKLAAGDSEQVLSLSLFSLSPLTPPLYVPFSPALALGVCSLLALALWCVRGMREREERCPERGRGGRGSERARERDGDR